MNYLERIFFYAQVSPYKVCKSSEVAMQPLTNPLHLNISYITTIKNCIVYYFRSDIVASESIFSLYSLQCYYLRSV